MILNLSFKRKNIFEIIRKRNKDTLLIYCRVVQFANAHYEFVMETPSTLPEVLFYFIWRRMVVVIFFLPNNLHTL